MNDLHALVNAANRLIFFQTRRRIIDHHLAVFREADTHDQVTGIFVLANERPRNLSFGNAPFVPTSVTRICAAAAGRFKIKSPWPHCLHCLSGREHACAEKVYYPATSRPFCKILLAAPAKSPRLRASQKFRQARPRSTRRSARSRNVRRDFWGQQNCFAIFMLRTVNFENVSAR